MKQPIRNDSAGRYRENVGAFDFLLTGVSLFALALTFALSYADLSFENKLIVFSFIAVLYVAFCLAKYVLYVKKRAECLSDEARRELETDVQNRLFALEEVNEFFGASLKPADMLRLAASRINELISFETCVFYILDENKAELKAEYVFGENAEAFKNTKISVKNGVAGKAILSRTPQFDAGVLSDKSVLSGQITKDFQSSIAAPLFRKGEITGVIQLFSDKKESFDDNSLELLEAVAERIAPMFAGSMAFERSLSNALTDSLTALPNERAFYLVLENQIAESTRFQNERPLTILSIDVHNFSQFNEKFGHAAGDRFLAFAGKNIKNQLRQMDFLARSSGDEFLAVLPTASGGIAAEVIERIERAFVTKPYKIAEKENIFLKLNFGTATFGRDGETAQQLLKTAVLRKQQAKTIEPGNVLWFPKEYAN